MKTDLTSFTRRLSVREVSSSLIALENASRDKLVHRARRVLSSSKLALDQDQRIASVKVILATASSNLALIRTLPDDFRSEAAYEIHFTLFCFMAPERFGRPHGDVGAGRYSRAARLPAASRIPPYAWFIRLPAPPGPRDPLPSLR